MPLNECLLEDTFPFCAEIIEPLIKVDPEAVELGCRQNPALLLQLAMERVDGCLWPDALLLKLLRERPRRLLAYLGYPAHWLRLFAKIQDPWLLKYDFLQLAISQFAEPSLARLYRHLPCLSRTVLLLGQRWPEVILESPALLQAAAKETSDAGSHDSIFENLSAIRSAESMLGRSAQRIEASACSVEWLRHRRCRLEIELMDRGLEVDVAFSHYPERAPKGWRLVTSLLELSEIAHEMNNCLMMYYPNLLAGQALLFLNRSSFSEVCCCLVFRAGERAWIRDMGFPSNRFIRDEEHEVIVATFQEAKIIHEG